MHRTLSNSHSYSKNGSPLKRLAVFPYSGLGYRLLPVNGKVGGILNKKLSVKFIPLKRWNN
jgi:hypothetical protein